MRKIVITRSEVRDFTRRACEENGLSETFFRDFWERLLERDDIYEEYVMYLAKKEFTSKVSVEGYHVIDIMIWQMDHFKSMMDRDRSANRSNEAYMILTAFDTFLKMARDPEPFVTLLQGETGTDYPGKTFS